LQNKQAMKNKEESNLPQVVAKSAGEDEKTYHNLWEIWIQQIYFQSPFLHLCCS